MSVANGFLVPIFLNHVNDTVPDRSLPCNPRA